MEYTAEVLDRATGDLKLTSLGDWITITEYGKRKGVGPRQVRAVLEHVGLLRQEIEASASGTSKVTRRRLTREAVDQASCKRLFPRKQDSFPFDVLSPAGQAWVDAKWDDAVATIASAVTASRAAKEAKDLLERFRARRRYEMTSQMEVCFLLEHFSDLPQVDIARVTGVSTGLVSRYSKIRADQIRKWQAIKRKQLPDQRKRPFRADLIDPHPE